MDQNTNRDELISSLIKRVYHLEQEVIKLGGSPYVEPEKIKPETYVTKPLGSQTIPANNTPIVNESDMPKRIAGYVGNNTAQLYAKPKETAIEDRVAANKAKQNIENKIGKNVMAIVGSILIFIALILFGGIAFMYLSDYAKAGLMYIFSIAIAAVGILKSPKRNAPPEKITKYKTFFTSLAACGISATYISGLVSYFAFGIFDLLVFAIITVAWLAATMVLAYNYSDIFVYICNAGLVISTLLVTFQFDSSILGFILYTICLIALYIIKHSDNFNKDCFYFIQYPIMYMLLTAISRDPISRTILFLIVIGFFIASNFIYTLREKHIVTHIVTFVLNMLAIIYFTVFSCIDDIMNNDTVLWLVIVIISSICATYYLKYKKSNIVLHNITYYMTLVLTVIFYLFTTIADYTSVLPFMILTFIGFALKDSKLRISGYVLFTLGTCYISISSNEYVVFGVITALVLICINCMMLISYSCVDKYFLTAIFILNVLRLRSEALWPVWVTFVVFAVIAAFMNTPLYYMDHKNKTTEPASKIIGYVINALTMFAGLICIASPVITKSVLILGVVILITTALYCINTKRLFNLRLSEMLIGIYICLKFTILILVILNRLDAVSFVISIAGILIAIACIILGFKTKHKSFRLYGLVISLISVAKLILFDIQYDSILLRPLGILVAGALCYVISFIYSKLEKNIKNES